MLFEVAILKIRGKKRDNNCILLKLNAVLIPFTTVTRKQYICYLSMKKIYLYRRLLKKLAVTEYYSQGTNPFAKVLERKRYIMQDHLMLIRWVGVRGPSLRPSQYPSENPSDKYFQNISRYHYFVRTICYQNDVTVIMMTYTRFRHPSCLQRKKRCYAKDTP